MKHIRVSKLPVVDRAHKNVAGFFFYSIRCERFFICIQVGSVENCFIFLLAFRVCRGVDAEHIFRVNEFLERNHFDASPLRNQRLGASKRGLSRLSY